MITKMSQRKRTRIEMDDFLGKVIGDLHLAVEKPNTDTGSCMQYKSVGY
jgi:hypothetical protein